jgi:hypothetical protein
LHISRKENLLRSARYSFIYRPAWRISQMGVYFVAFRWQAIRKGYCFPVSFITSIPTLSNGKSTAFSV